MLGNRRVTASPLAGFLVTVASWSLPRVLAAIPHPPSCR